MRMIRVAVVVVLAIGFLAGTPAFADSLFKQASAKAPSLIAKRDRFQPGDIITVLIKETIDSSVTSNTNTKKESDVESEAAASENPFLVTRGPRGLNIINEEELPNWNISAKNETKARGDTRRQSKLTASISCVVTHVLDNGLLGIEGNKVVSMNREDCRIRVSGLVRSRDVSPQNTIDSSLIANAVVELKGRGPLWNNQRRGFVTRLLDWFSPF